MSAPSRIRLMLVDDHYVVRMGLQAVFQFESDLQVVAEAEDGQQAIDLFQEHQPDVTLMDLRMPGLSGLETTIRIHESFPSARIVMLTTFDGDEDIFRALEAGATGYLLKNAPRRDLVSAIRKVHAGERYIPEAVARRLAERIGTTALSERETEVLRLAGKGFGNKEIARLLEVTEHTAKAHMKNILEKLGVGDRTEAITVALQRGILHLDD
jgi:DNA-binding NarL/FixJ family response regulator